MFTLIRSPVLLCCQGPPIPQCFLPAMGGGGLELNGVAWSPESRGSLNMKLIFLYGFHSYYYDLKKHFINVLQTGRGPRALSIGSFQLPLPTCQGHLTARPNHSRLLPSRMRDPKRVLLAAPKFVVICYSRNGEQM